MTEETTVRVRFHASKELPRWRHREGGKERVPYGSQGHTTTRIRPPVIMEDKDAVEMTAWEAQWATTMYPDNFEILTPDVNPLDPAFDPETCDFKELQEAAKQLEVSARGSRETLEKRVQSAIKKRQEQDAAPPEGEDA